MASSWFLKLAFKCVAHFAWPLLALGYPLCASVQAIETDSHEDTRELISYWILLSLIYLFEYAFTRLLQWFQFWPYMKLIIIFWLIIPDFGRASYVYNNLIRPCISMKQSVICRLNNYWRNFFVEKDNFLQNAERYIKENGTEALEKLIASKNTMNKPNAEAANEIRATDNKEMQPNTMIKSNAEAANAIRATDNKEMQPNTMNKPDAEAANAIRATDNKEMQPTNGEILQTEHKGIKDWEVVEKNEIPASKQDIPVIPNLVPSQNASSAMMETKGILGTLPQSSTHNEVQIEWTCALCQVTTTCEETLNSHLKGRRHRDTREALKAKTIISQKVKISQLKEELKQKNGINQQNSNARNANELKGTVVMDHKVQNPQKNLYEPVRMKSSKFKCVVCDVNLESEANVASHFNGKKHLANFPKLIV